MGRIPDRGAWMSQANVPHVVMAEPCCSPLVTFDQDALGLDVVAWRAPCEVSVSWRLPPAARFGPITVAGASAWERRGFWMTVEVEAPATVRVTRPADLDGDGFVDAADLSVLLGDWGGPEIRSDLNFDGSVDAVDHAILLGDWGNGGVQ